MWLSANLTHRHSAWAGVFVLSGTAAVDPSQTLVTGAPNIRNAARADVTVGSGRWLRTVRSPRRGDFRLPLQAAFDGSVRQRRDTDLRELSTYEPSGGKRAESGHACFRLPALAFNLWIHAGRKTHGRNCRRPACTRPSSSTRAAADRHPSSPAAEWTAGCLARRL